MDLNKEILTIQRYLAKQHVFTLCTYSTQDFWCASCFYVFDADSMAFWFMTETDTRHGHLMQKNPVVAGTVAGQTRNIAKIKGIQFRGEVIRLTGEDEAVARARYCRRFPVALTAKSPVWQLNLNEIKWWITPSASVKNGIGNVSIMAAQGYWERIIIVSSGLSGYDCPAKSNCGVVQRLFEFPIHQYIDIVDHFALNLA